MVHRHMRRCTFCTTRVVGDVRQYGCDCSYCHYLWLEYDKHSKDAHDALPALIWHKNQKSVYDILQRGPDIIADLP